jgi:phosphate transport system protein
VSDFQTDLQNLHDDLNKQGDRVLALALNAVDSFFDRDKKKAEASIASDSEIDRVDVEIEQHSIPLLATGEASAQDIRAILTIVKVNNELERIADCAVNIAECVVNADNAQFDFPNTFRVMANSVIGMCRDANRALRDGNAELARQVLLFDDTVDRFKTEILLNAQARVASGEFTVETAFSLMTVTKSLERIADHATNVCEQVIYLKTGRTVRHDPSGWSDPFEPLADRDETA